MKISDLQALLRATKKQHGDIEICYDLHSDTMLMEPSAIAVIEAVPKLYGGEAWLTAVHLSMTDEQKARARKYLNFPGN